MNKRLTVYVDVPDDWSNDKIQDAAFAALETDDDTAPISVSVCEPHKEPDTLNDENRIEILAQETRLKIFTFKVPDGVDLTQNPDKLLHELAQKLMHDYEQGHVDFDDAVQSDVMFSAGSRAIDDMLCAQTYESVVVKDYAGEIDKKYFE